MSKASAHLRITTYLSWLKWIKAGKPVTSTVAQPPVRAVSEEFEQILNDNS